MDLQGVVVVEALSTAGSEKSLLRHHDPIAVLEASPNRMHWVTLSNGIQSLSITDETLLQHEFTILTWSVKTLEGSKEIKEMTPEAGETFCWPSNVNSNISVSISNRGDYVAICWPETEKLVSDLACTNCTVFHLTTPEGIPAPQEWNNIKFSNSCQGVVTFLPDDSLAIVNLNEVVILDHIHGSHRKYTIDISPLIPHAFRDGAHDQSIYYSEVNQHVDFYKQCIHRGILVSTSAESELLQVWSTRSGQLLSSFKCGALSAYTSVALSSDGRFVAIHKWNGWPEVKVYYLDSGVLAQTLPLDRMTQCRTGCAPLVFDFTEDDRILLLLRCPEKSGSPIVVDKWDLWRGLRVSTDSQHIWEPHSRVIGLTKCTLIEGIPYIFDEDSVGKLMVSQMVDSQRTEQLASDNPMDVSNRIPMSLDVTIFSEFNDECCSRSGGIWIWRVGDIVLRCGNNSIQVWDTLVDEVKLTRNSTKLRFIWCTPLKRNFNRKQPELSDFRQIKWDIPEDSKEGRPLLSVSNDNRLSVALEDEEGNDIIDIDVGNLLSPRDCDVAEYAAHALFCLRLVRKDIVHGGFVDKMVREVKEILQVEMSQPNGHFSTIAGGQSFAELIRACADGDPFEESLVKRALDVDGFKPWIYTGPELRCCQISDNVSRQKASHSKYTNANEHSHELESVLSVAVDYERTESVRAIATWLLSKKWPENPGYMSAFTSVLPKLSEKYPDLVEEWMDYINFTPALPRTTYPFIDGQNPAALHLGKNQRAPINDLYAFSMNEQLLKTTFGRYLLRPLSSLLRHIDSMLERGYNIIFSPKIHAITVCSMPFFSFFSYTIHRVDRETGMMIRIKQTKSAFSRMALGGHRDVFGVEMMEAALLFYWRASARRIWAVTFTAYLVYYILFLVGVVGNAITSIVAQTAIVSIVLAAAGALVIQEVRQMFRYKAEYLNVYNLIDIGAYGLPLAASALKLVELWAPDIYSGVSQSYSAPQIQAIATFILWIHMLQQLRVIKPLGILIATVIEIGKRVFWMIFLQLIIVMAFAHALNILISPSNGYTGDFFANSTQSSGPVTLANAEGNSLTGNVTISSGDESTNGFRSFYYSFRSVWFFSSGDWGPADAITDSLLLQILVGIYSLVVVIVLLNILIAMINDVFTETKEKGKRVWLHMFAEVIAEIETTWSTEALRQDRNRHPAILYYVASTDVVKKWRQNIDKNMERSK